MRFTFKQYRNIAHAIVVFSFYLFKRLTKHPLRIFLVKWTAKIKYSKPMIDNQRAIFDLVNNILYIFTFSGKRKKAIHIVSHVNLFLLFLLPYRVCIDCYLYSIYIYCLLRYTKKPISHKKQWLSMKIDLSLYLAIFIMLGLIEFGGMKYILSVFGMEVTLH